MAHKHNYEPSGGCDENPGVWINGKVMRTLEVCECGAKREELHSILPHDNGILRTVTLPNGRERVTDTRDWF